ncbi:helix-turn-helix domain-containing protein [Aureimonas sp. D3]|uniref:helix-turn-helix domain-containing protein n=1 Tax=Aureimonas sp. D3 TaxID=1638164 RepID=UPI0009EB6538|nr:helix-turn-helix domain-containing protein [Aureimonas sp. D3]
MRFDEFNTGTLPPDERYEAWRRQALPCLGGLMQTTLTEGGFSARSRTFDLTSLSLSDVHLSAQTASRTDHMIRSDGLAPVAISVCLAGRYSGQTETGPYRGGAGSVLVMDFGAPFEHVSTNAHNAIALFERREIERHLPRIDGLHGLVLSRKDADPLVRHVAVLLKHLPDMSQDAGVAAGEALTRTIVSLLNQTSIVSVSEEAQLSRLRADALWIIRQRYREPDLDVTRVAALARTSRSTLYRAFAGEDGISACIINLRIEQVAIALRDIQDNRLIREIAQSVGFDQVSSFNRAFRKRYGCTPREWRDRFRGIRSEEHRRVRVSDPDVCLPRSTTHRRPSNRVAI